MEKSKKRKLRLETYRPKRRMKVSKDDTVPFLIRIGAAFVAMGGVVSFFMSSAIIGAKSFFEVKQKVYNKKMLGKRYVELRIKER